MMDSITQLRRERDELIAMVRDQRRELDELGDRIAALSAAFAELRKRLPDPAQP